MSSPSCFVLAPSRKLLRVTKQLQLSSGDAKRLPTLASVVVSEQPVLDEAATKAIVATVEESNGFRRCPDKEANTVDTALLHRQPADVLKAVWPCLRAASAACDQHFALRTHRLPDAPGSWDSKEGAQRNRATFKEWEARVNSPVQISRYTPQSRVPRSRTRRRPRYTAGIEPHRDSDDVAFIVSLNDTFKGGGTRYCNVLRAGQNIVRQPVGHLLLHHGQTCHAGHPVSDGVRYILTGQLCAVQDTKPENGEFHPNSLRGDLEAIAESHGFVKFSE
jgi:hypothetical protein